MYTVADQSHYTITLTGFSMISIVWPQTTEQLVQATGATLTAAGFKLCLLFLSHVTFLHLPSTFLMKAFSPVQ